MQDCLAHPAGKPIIYLIIFCADSYFCTFSMQEAAIFCA